MKSQQLRLYSRQAERLMRGRKADKQAGQYAIHGLFQFAAKTKVVWQDAQQGNPFAWFYWLRFNKKLETATLALRNYQQDLNQRANDGTGFDYQPDKSARVAHPFDIAFVTPEAWKAVRVVKQFDHIVLQSQYLVKVGLITRDNHYASVRELSRQVTAVFQEASLYRSIAGITVDNVRSLTKVQQKMAKVMGERVPDFVLRTGAKQWLEPPTHG